MRLLTGTLKWQWAYVGLRRGKVFYNLILCQLFYLCGRYLMIVNGVML